jgi:hypothetical protein
VWTGNYCSLKVFHLVLITNYYLCHIFVDSSGFYSQGASLRFGG